MRVLYRTLLIVIWTLTAVAVIDSSRRLIRFVSGQLRGSSVFEIVPLLAEQTVGIGEHAAFSLRLFQEGIRTQQIRWQATGGRITPSGLYIAGDTIGQYLVIATGPG